MNYQKQIAQMLELNGGVITTADIKVKEIPTIYLTRMVRDGQLTRIGRGIYMSDQGEYDELALFQAQYKKSVFSYETSLYLLGMTDKIPQEIHVSVDAHYKFNQKPEHVIVHYVKTVDFSVGIESVKTIYGNPVNTTNAERTICDLVAHRDQVEPEVFGKALRRYARQGDLNQLYQMAKTLGMTDRVQQTMEVLV